MSYPPEYTLYIIIYLYDCSIFGDIGDYKPDLKLKAKSESKSESSKYFSNRSGELDDNGKLESDCPSQAKICVVHVDVFFCDKNSSLPPLTHTFSTR